MDWIFEALCLPWEEYTFLMQSRGPVYLWDFGSCSLSFCVCSSNFTLSTGAAKDLLHIPLNPPDIKLEMNTAASPFREADEDEAEEVDADMESANCPPDERQLRQH